MLNIYVSFQPNGISKVQQTKTKGHLIVGERKLISDNPPPLSHPQQQPSLTITNCIFI